jgi:hypothetical protein
MGPGVHISDVVNDERIVSKVRSEMDFQITAVKIAIEKKISATLLEMDRLFKLLQIRPTMSEMQMVVVSLNDIKPTLKSCLSIVIVFIISALLLAKVDFFKFIINVLSLPL